MTAATSPLRLLILGGTGEAMAVARALQGDGRFAPVYSVAGRTRNPRLPDLPSRVGGFGGPEGLAAYLREQGVQVLLDATHPFAARISANAAAAARATGVSLLALRRPLWTPGPGEEWRMVADMDAAARALGEAPRRVLLTIGQLELAAFCRAPQHHYLVRSVELPEIRPPRCECLTLRGPFQLEDELELMRTQRIDTLVTKNSGGEATRPKLEAARRCGVAVVMVQRPPVPDVAQTVPGPEAALDWLRQRAGAPCG
ncbi:cobalt-precorrin-6A reductase [Ectothiorhodospira mobilis]|uniref:cobalt-precorrin-6A reductase n=1 Tax=Ectothiorhodospira mobilis TaxID=195064 RepID=UPI0019070FC4|nr:cobalt-precorrin-6A reductase [Ectothiorhodospira mobilis]MBK1691784.1 cobalt-precorrin-6A reductase [Ectothiorhodospira mobilis]